MVIDEQRIRFNQIVYTALIQIRELGSVNKGARIMLHVYSQGLTIRDED